MKKNWPRIGDDGLCINEADGLGLKLIVQTSSQLTMSRQYAESAASRLDGTLHSLLWMCTNQTHSDATTCFTKAVKARKVAAATRGNPVSVKGLSIRLPALGIQA